MNVIIVKVKEIGMVDMNLNEVLSDQEKCSNLLCNDYSLINVFFNSTIYLANRHILVLDKKKKKKRK